MLYNVTNGIITNNSIYDNYANSIYLDSSSDNKIINNTIQGNSYDGIDFDHFSSNILINNSIHNNSGEGIDLEYSSSNTIKYNLLSNNTGWGAYINSGSNDNIIYADSLYYNGGSGDTFNSLYFQAYDNGTDNCWNSSAGIGNYWYDWANNNDTNDQNHDGIVDWPYLLDGSAGAENYYPLKNNTTANILSHPLNLLAVAGNGYVNLSWKAPAYGNNTVTAYRIYRNGVLIDTVPASQLW